MEREQQKKRKTDTRVHSNNEINRDKEPVLRDKRPTDRHTHNRKKERERESLNFIIA